MGPSEHHPPSAEFQGSRRVGRRWPRRRCCLLKGCERYFRPGNPFERYCSQGCRAEARLWQLWYAQKHYRQSDNGKERRREQSRRYRRRRREKLEKVKTDSLMPRRCDARVGSTEESLNEDENGHPPGCEGHQQERQEKNSEILPCSRPGCYELFPPEPRSPQKRFCSSLCRSALRRVVQRETRWRQRRYRQVG